MVSPSEISFRFDQLRSEATNQSQDWEIWLKINADFSIILRDRTFYREPDFPVVEFAAQASRWLKQDDRNFFYTSLESEEDPLISFQTIGNEMLIPYSPHQCMEAYEINRAALRLSLQEFVDEVRSVVLRDCEIDVDRLL